MGLARLLDGRELLLELPRFLAGVRAAAAKGWDVSDVFLLPFASYMRFIAGLNSSKKQDHVKFLYERIQRQRAERLLRRT